MVQGLSVGAGRVTIKQVWVVDDQALSSTAAVRHTSCAVRRVSCLMCLSCERACACCKDAARGNNIELCPQEATLTAASADNLRDGLIEFCFPKALGPVWPVQYAILHCYVRGRPLGAVGDSKSPLVGAVWGKSKIDTRAINRRQSRRTARTMTTANSIPRAGNSNRNLSTSTSKVRKPYRGRSDGLGWTWTWLTASLASSTHRSVGTWYCIYIVHSTHQWRLHGAGAAEACTTQPCSSGH